VTAIVTDTSEIKLWDWSKDSTSFLIFVGVVASEEVIAILTLALPSLNAASWTRPKETMSRLNPGYLICLSSSNILFLSKATPLIMGMN
jgi:hypothetical protein